MPIPEAQLKIWSHQGSIKQSSATYQSIKATLEGANTPYTNQSYRVFLQGSYGNDTNIYAESDVDVVIRLDSSCFHNGGDLPEDQRALLNQALIDADYTYIQFRKDVFDTLVKAYGPAVKQGDKAITIAPEGNRRKADVIVACHYRLYEPNPTNYNSPHIKGICFYTGKNVRMVNYPEQHSANCTNKHQGTDEWFKPAVRIFKNMRSKMVEDNLIGPGIAPSYYLEGLLFNVDKENFGNSFEDTVVNSLNWILKADRSKFVCANQRYKLLHPSSPVTWRQENCDAFLNGAVKLWKNWGN